MVAKGERSRTNKRTPLNAIPNRQTDRQTRGNAARRRPHHRQLTMKVDRRELSRRHTDYRLLVSAAPPDCIISPQFASRENGATMGRGGGGARRALRIRSIDFICTRHAPHGRRRRRMSNERCRSRQVVTYADIIGCITG